MENKELIELALKSKERAYVPYSGFRVGAAVEMEDGTVYQGANIENASLSPTICAERNAIFKAVFEGRRKIKKIAVVGDSEYTYPCGVCRQVIREFSDNAKIIVAKDVDNYREYDLDELLPNSFGPESMKEHKHD